MRKIRSIIIILLLCGAGCTTSAIAQPTGEGNEPPAPSSNEETGRLVGRVLPNDNDSTLLKLVYYTYSKYDSIFVHRGGFMWEGSKDTNLQNLPILTVEQRYGDGSTEFVYLGGMIRSMMMAPYTESQLLLRRHQKGWQVKESYETNYAPYRRDMTMMGILDNQYFLTKEFSSESPNGGYFSSTVHFRLQSRDSINACNNLNLRIRQTNQNCTECALADSLHRYCYYDKGTWSCSYSSTLNCLIFDYGLTCSLDSGLYHSEKKSTKSGMLMRIQPCLVQAMF